MSAEPPPPRNLPSPRSPRSVSNPDDVAADMTRMPSSAKKSFPTLVCRRTALSSDAATTEEGRAFISLRRASTTKRLSPLRSAICWLNVVPPCVSMGLSCARSTNAWRAWAAASLTGAHPWSPLRMLPRTTRVSQITSALRYMSLLFSNWNGRPQSCRIAHSGRTKHGSSSRSPTIVTTRFTWGRSSMRKPLALCRHIRRIAPHCRSLSRHVCLFRNRFRTFARSKRPSLSVPTFGSGTCCASAWVSVSSPVECVAMAEGGAAGRAGRAQCSAGQPLAERERRVASGYGG